MGRVFSVIRVDYTPNADGLLKVWITNTTVKRANSQVKYYSPEQSKFFSENGGRYYEWLYAPQNLRKEMQERLNEQA